ncbi:MAG TPA: hypothetical protein VIW24_00115 [Aldersonia sp.]
MERGLLLYRWNAAVSGALWESLGHGEVVLRNAIHDALTARHLRLGRPGQWYDDPAGELEHHARQDIATAQRRLQRAGAPLLPGKIVAELSFGFWRFLLARRYTANLWPAIRPAFPHLPGRDRRLLEEPVTRLHRLRNRVAHHEPLIHEDLAARLSDLAGILDAVEPALRSWVQSDSRLPAILEQRP